MFINSIYKKCLTREKLLNSFGKWDQEKKVNEEDHKDTLM